MRALCAPCSTISFFLLPLSFPLFPSPLLVTTPSPPLTRHRHALHLSGTFVSFTAHHTYTTVACLLVHQPHPRMRNNCITHKRSAVTIVPLLTVLHMAPEAIYTCCMHV